MNDVSKRQAFAERLLAFHIKTPMRAAATVSAVPQKRVEMIKAFMSPLAALIDSM